MRFLILVRHATRQVRWDCDESAHDIEGWPQGGPTSLSASARESNFKRAGADRTLALAGRLADELKAADVRVCAISSSSHKVARQTACLFSAVLDERRVPRDRKDQGADASGVEQYAPLEPGQHKPGDRVLADLHGKLPKGSPVAWVLVGHQPHLTEIAESVVRKIPGKVLPISGSELACIDVDRKRVLWLLTERPDTLLAELREKVRSKMEVAKFFLGTLLVNTGLILSQGTFTPTLTRDAMLVGVGLFLLLAALSFTAATLFAYDRLLMPLDFWGGSRASVAHPAIRSIRHLAASWLGWVRGSTGSRDDEVWALPPKWSVLRPPSQAHLIVYYEMVHAWNRFFVPAVGLSFGAVALFIVGLSGRLPLAKLFYLPREPAWWLLPGVLTAACLVAFGTGWIAYRLGKPELGTTD